MRVGGLWSGRNSSVVGSGHGESVDLSFELSDASLESVG